MKNIIILLILCTCSCFTHAQKIVEKHMAFSQQKSINLDIQIADSIRIVTWNKSEVYAKASIDINDNKDNEVYVTNFDEKGNSIEVKAEFDDKKKAGYNDSCHCCCNYNSKIYWDIYIPEQSSFSVETIDGNIVIQGNTKEIKAHSISGFIDLSFASSRKADLDMSTVSGTIYTNLALNDASKRNGGNNVRTQYNGGGEDVELETVSGDIFLRKAE
ncbi:MAG TPA: DUF4097 family beta strand repeat-containing protein [Parafilimonas sp.]|nr:DUF4097 family beta strand repeat-containing protein [Parafilimonas sp.]